MHKSTNIFVLAYFFNCFFTFGDLLEKYDDKNLFEIPDIYVFL